MLLKFILMYIKITDYVDFTIYVEVHSLYRL